MDAYVRSNINTFMPRARLCRVERKQLPKSQHIPIPMTCAIYRGAYTWHNPGGILLSKVWQTDSIYTP